MQRPSPSRAELRTAEGLRVVLAQLVGELEPRRLDWDAMAARAAEDPPAEVIDRLRAEFVRAAEPPDLFGLDKWLTRELTMDFDPAALTADARSLLVEISIRWIVIIGMLRQPRRALGLASIASTFAMDDSGRARVALASCHTLTGCGRGDLPAAQAVREALAAHARARMCGVDDVAATFAELQIRGFAGRAGELPVRHRLRHLAAAAQLADKLIGCTADDRVRDETVIEQTRIARDRERLATLGWFHRWVGFAPDS